MPDFNLNINGFNGQNATYVVARYYAGGGNYVAVSSASTGRDIVLPDGNRTQRIESIVCGSAVEIFYDGTDFYVKTLTGLWVTT